MYLAPGEYLTLQGLGSELSAVTSSGTALIKYMVQG